jgi:hypothetical protein
MKDYEDAMIHLEKVISEAQSTLLNAEEARNEWIKMHEGRMEAVKKQNFDRR